MENFNPQFQKIGDILVYQKIITSNDLESALLEQKKLETKPLTLLMGLPFLV